MATITGLTAARMQAIENASVVGGSVVGDNLILTKKDNSTINAGNVRGPQGPMPQFVTSLPGSPTDLQEVYFQTSAMATLGIAWHLKYRQGTGKWQYLGGQGWHVYTQTAVTANSTTMTAKAGGPSITVPLPGRYLARFGVKIQPTQTAPYGVISLFSNGVVLTDTSVAFNCGGASATMDGNFSKDREIAILAANDVLEHRYQSGSTNMVTFSERFITLIPILLG